MTFQDLLTALHAADPALPVHLVTPAARMTQAYNLTEVSHARKASLDCTGQPHHWDEAQVDILATGGDGLDVHKLRLIAAQAAQGLPALAGSELRAQLDMGGGGASTLHTVTSARAGADSFDITLAPKATQCKAAAAFAGLAILPKRQRPFDTKAFKPEPWRRKIGRYTAKKLAALNALAGLKTLIWPLFVTAPAVDPGPVSSGAACC